jgi:hypothetical protein
LSAWSAVGIFAATENSNSDTFNLTGRMRTGDSHAPADAIRQITA